MTKLALFDVDGTLFLTHDPLAGTALRETLEERFDVELPKDAIERVDHAGQTSLRIARLVLGQAGVDEPVGLGIKPTPVFLKPGDTMRLGITGLGEQKQRVVEFRAPNR